jgi:trehalose 6-phosphate synthase/phosphatase
VREGEDPLVWVHDYQLMLLPAMLKEAAPQLRIGFFLHTPFPAFEIFRCNPKRAELIKGVLGADLIGFHTFGYLRYFRSTAQRVLGLDPEMMRIPHDGRLSTLGIYPIGINAKRFDEAIRSEKLEEQRRTIRRTYGEKRIILSVERMDYTKGIPQRLDAIDLFLSSLSPGDRDGVKFIFVSVPSRENIDEYQALVEDVEGRVGRLNGKHATLHNSPIHFIHGSVNFEELCALYSVADACVVTPLIDGMNLVAKEFVAAQRTDDANAHNGVLILSEFAGAAEELFNALIVNPYDTSAVADAIRAALAMDDAERRRRMIPMRERVMKFDAAWWARSFVADLQTAGPARGSIGSDQRIDDARRRLTEAIASGRRVGLFLDYDGTLREIEREPWAASPNPQVRSLLQRLEKLPSVDVTLISGRSPADMENWFGGYARFGLIAEHGADLRPPGEREWQHLDAGINYSWREPLLKVLKLYEDSTPGSWLEVKRSSLVWHYRMADPEFGSWKARQLTEELAVLTANEPVQVRHGRKIVEITTTQVNKGSAVQRIVEERGGYDLILIAGDDVTDESMFRANLAGAGETITIKVGEGETTARYRLPNQAGLRSLLTAACEASRFCPSQTDPASLR